MQRSCIVWGALRRLWQLLDLMNGDLRVDGFVKNYTYIRTHIPRAEGQFHNTPVDEIFTSALVNVLYKVKEDQCQTFNLFGAFKYYYDMAPTTDYQLRSAIPSSQRSWYQKPKDEDIIAEAYADYIRGPFNIKVRQADRGLGRNRYQAHG